MSTGGRGMSHDITSPGGGGDTVKGPSGSGRLTKGPVCPGLKRLVLEQLGDWHHVIGSRMGVSQIKANHTGIKGSHR